MCFSSKPSIPKPPPPPEPLKDADTTVSNARSRQKRLAAAAGGLGNTVKTSPLGTVPPPPGGKTLLGE